MTCIGIEMIGSYKYGDVPGDRNDHFKKLAKDMSPRFGEIRPTRDGAKRDCLLLVKRFQELTCTRFLWQMGFYNSPEKRRLRHSGTVRKSSFSSECLLVLSALQGGCGGIFEESPVS